MDILNKKLYVEIKEKYMFIINLKKSVLLTYLGVIFGVISMTLAFTKMAFADV